MAFQMYNNILIIDYGQSSVKSGFQSEEVPSVIFDSVLGFPKYKQQSYNQQENIIINPQSNIRGLYRLKRPIERGVVCEKIDLKLILKYIQTELKFQNQKQTPIFFCEPSLNSKEQKLIFIDSCLELFDCPSIGFGNQAVLSMLAFGRTNGLSLETGEGLSQIVPVYKGLKIDQGIEKWNFAGCDITKMIQKLFFQYNINIHSQAEDLIIKQMKNELASVKINTLDNLAKSKRKIETGMSSKALIASKIFTLPDGSKIDTKDIFEQASELLFDPNQFRYDKPSLQEMIMKSL